MSLNSNAEDVPELRPLAFRLELQSMSALLSALTAIARLGSWVTYVRATEREAVLGILAPARVAHLVSPRLSQIIEVLTVAPTTLPTTEGGPGTRE